MLEGLKKCFDINLNDYENINFSLEINKAVLGAFVAIIVGVIFLNAYRGSMRFMIMQLTRHSATSEENAKTLKELGLSDSRMLKRILSSDNLLTKTVERVGAVKYDYETYKKMSDKERKNAEKIDFDVAKFYIKEDETSRAAFILERYVTSITRTLVSCLFVAIICGCIIACMPGILNVVNELLGNIKR